MVDLGFDFDGDVYEQADPLPDFVDDSQYDFIFALFIVCRKYGWECVFLKNNSWCYQIVISILCPVFKL